MPVWQWWWKDDEHGTTASGSLRGSSRWAQVANFNAQLNELEMTIEAVKQQPEGYSLHKNLENVLIEVTDKDKLISELENQLLILKDAVVRIGEKEAH